MSSLFGSKNELVIDYNDLTDELTLEDFESLNDDTLIPKRLMDRYCELKLGRKSFGVSSGSGKYPSDRSTSFGRSSPKSSPSRKSRYPRPSYSSSKSSRSLPFTPIYVYFDEEPSSSPFRMSPQRKLPNKSESGNFLTNAFREINEKLTDAGESIREAVSRPKTVG